MSKKGYKQSQEHKDNLSASLRGRDIGFGKGCRHTQASKDKMSATLKENNKRRPKREFTQEHKDKICAAMSGKQNRLGIIQSQEEREKHSITMQGKQNRLGTLKTQEECDKISKTLMGNTNSLGKNLGENNPNWNGGYDIAQARREKKRRGFGFISLNNRFFGSVAHHMDKDFVVNIPEKTHRSVYHSVTKDINMDIINNLAISFVYGD